MKLKIKGFNVFIGKEKDLVDVVRLSENLFKLSGYRGPFDNKKCIDSVLPILRGENEESIVLLIEKDDETIGILGAATFSPLWNRDKYACELLFLCPNISAMGILLDAYENWARSKGCKYCQIGLLSKKRRVLFKDYIAGEQMFIKELR